jgi:asparagine N-glycosylation enzyme membrane subunit Stt3
MRILAAALPGMALWLLGALGWVLSGQASFHMVNDADSYVHVVRLLEILDRGSWAGGLILRDGAPGGYALHWTMPMDLLMLALAAPLAPAQGWEAAILAVAPFGGVVTGLMLVAAMAWAVAPCGRPSASVLAGLMVAAAPTVMSYGRPGIYDHHALIETTMVLALGAAWRLAGREDRLWAGVQAGVLAALALWTALEALPAAALTAAFALLLTTLDPAGRRRSALGFGLALPLATAFFLTLDPPATAMTVDRLSPVFLALAALAGALVLIARLLPERRLAWMGALSLAAAAVWLAVFLAAWKAAPLFPDPAVARFMWEQTTEMQPPPWPSVALLALGPGLIGLAVALVRALLAPNSAARWRWVAAAVALAILSAIGAHWARLSFHAATLGAAIAGIGLTALMERPLGLAGRLGRSVLVAAMVATPMLAGLTLAGGIGTTQGRCDVSALAARLDAQGPAIVMADVNLSPPLLYYSRHLRTVSGPYHKNGGGMTDLVHFGTSGDEAEARKIMDERGATLVLLCADESMPPGPMRQRLRDGRAPPWLERVELSAPEEADLRLYRRR